MERARPETGRKAPARRTRALLVGGAAAALAATAALASETIRYEYDARGRLVKVVRTDSATGQTVTTEHVHDKADNRTKRETK